MNRLNKEASSAASQEAHALEIWIWCFSPGERLKYIRRHRSQFEFSSYVQMLDVVRGRRFIGCALTLINWRNRVRANTWRAALIFCIVSWALIIFVGVRIVQALSE